MYFYSHCYIKWREHLKPCMFMCCKTGTIISGLLFYLYYFILGSMTMFWDLPSFSWVHVEKQASENNSQNRHAWYWLLKKITWKTWNGGWRDGGGLAKWLAHEAAKLEQLNSIDCNRFANRMHRWVSADLSAFLSLQW